MEAEEDIDGDGYGTAGEFFFGTDVLTADEVYLEIISKFALVRRVPRNKLAADALPALWESDNLTNWYPIDPASTAIRSVDAFRDFVELEVPDESSSLPRFFKVSAPW